MIFGSVGVMAAAFLWGTSHRIINPGIADYWVSVSRECGDHMVVDKITGNRWLITYHVIDAHSENKSLKKEGQSDD